MNLVGFENVTSEVTDPILWISLYHTQSQQIASCISRTSQLWYW